MPTIEPLRVFISYARKDGAALAQRLQSDLTKGRFDAWLDTQRITGGAVWSTEIEHEIDTRQVTIALLSPGSYASEICRAEQLRALDKGNRVIPVLAVKGADRPLYLYARQYRDFTDEVNYPARLGELLADIRGDATATLPDTYRKTRVTYLTAPPRVANYLERTEALHALRDALFAEDHRQPVALTALAGMGGIGKTVLAQALTEDEVVQRAFPDGIVWITAGKDKRRDFVEEMREVAKALGDDLSGYENAVACENQYRTTIATKAVLIVVDDVWRKADIEPLLAESPRSRFLFTTRDAAIGRFVSAHEHRADLLDVAQSRELLASWANLPVAELPAAADEVIAECGRLPLALSVVGAMLRGADAEYWTDTLDLLRKADLSAIQERLPEGQQSYFKAVEVSIHSLAPKMRERYKAMAVLLEDMSAPLPILETLWNVDEPEARWTSKHFVDRSLAQRDGGSEGIRLHDLQLDYVRAQYPDREALDLIQGAIILSSHVIGRDPAQFASQMVGRLLPHQGVPAIEQFMARLVEGSPKPWLRPLQPALHPPGTPLVRTLEGQEGHVGVAAVSADGQRAISLSWDMTIKVLDSGTGLELCKLEPDDLDFFHVVVMSEDGRRAVSVPLGRPAKVWDLETGLELRTLEGHSEAVNAVAVSADGRRGVSASRDKTLKVWDLETGRELRTLVAHAGSVTGVAVSADGRHMVSVSVDGTLKVWDLERGRQLRPQELRSNGVIGVAVSGDGRRAVSACEDGTLRVWDVEIGHELRTLKGHSSCVVAVSSDGRRVVSASADKSLKVWDLGSGRKVRVLTDNLGAAGDWALSADGRRAVSTSFHKMSKVWDVETGRKLHTLKEHSRRVVNKVAMSGDGRRAVFSFNDQTFQVWDLDTGRKLFTLVGHSSSIVCGVAVSGDGQRAVSACENGTLEVWDLEMGRELFSLESHSSLKYGVLVSDVAVSADGRRAVSASADKTLKVWRLDTGALIATFTCDVAVRSCAFIAGDKLIGGDAVGHVHFLSLEE